MSRSKNLSVALAARVDAVSRVGSELMFQFADVLPDVTEPGGGGAYGTCLAKYRRLSRNRCQVITKFLERM